MAESFEFTKLDDSIDIGIAILFVGCIGIAIANTGTF